MLKYLLSNKASPYLADKVKLSSYIYSCSYSSIVRCLLNTVDLNSATIFTLDVAPEQRSLLLFHPSALIL